MTVKLVSKGGRTKTIEDILPNTDQRIIHQKKEKMGSSSSRNGDTNESDPKDKHKHKHKKFKNKVKAQVRHEEDHVLKDLHDALDNVHPALPWLKQGSVITIESKSEKGGILRVRDENGDVEISKKQGRQGHWEVEIVDMHEKLLKLKSRYNKRFLRVHRTTKRAFFFGQKEVFEVKADGEEDQEEAVFKVVPDEGAFQLQSQAYPEKYVGPDAEKHTLAHRSSKYEGSRKVVAALPGDDALWAVKKISSI
ncbi:hypothetical protein RFI_15558 [Reticulomyxa filosa]|uniref:Uncharacterized protein n=1 Tax=Reticulomyxa filosa TaxID=46433 RepID=X6N5T1_RETFI|nr:hypothetical protein RFI_15558 [Reticulomyxa filosa]|eukprot:ETO21645.1 hypothetical protein RFI_15558 [Reticulomyxa filosa]